MLQLYLIITCRQKAIRKDSCLISTTSKSQQPLCSIDRTTVDITRKGVNWPDQTSLFEPMIADVTISTTSEKHIHIAMRVPLSNQTSAVNTRRY